MLRGFPLESKQETEKKLTSTISIASERCPISVKSKGRGEVYASRETARKRGTQGAPSESRATCVFRPLSKRLKMTKIVVSNQSGVCIN